MLGVVHAVRGQRVALTDLDTQIGSVQSQERLLVGDVVAEEDRGAGPGLVTQDVERLTFVGDDHGQFDDRLALGDLYPVPGGRSGAGTMQRGVGVGLGGVAHMQRGARRLGLYRDALVVGRDRTELDDEGVEEFVGSRGDLVHEADVELTAVTTDQVHLGRQPRQGREIAEGAAGDHGCGGAVELGQRTHGAHRVGVGAGVLRPGDDRGHAAVVVRGDQQPGHTCDGFEGATQFRVEVLCTHSASLRPPTPVASNPSYPGPINAAFVTLLRPDRCGGRRSTWSRGRRRVRRGNSRPTAARHARAPGGAAPASDVDPRPGLARGRRRSRS